VRLFLRELSKVRTWLFWGGYSWSAATVTWGLTVFTQAAKSDEALITWMPFIANSTFVFGPFVGAFVDARGFSIPVAVVGISIASLALMLMFAPIPAQWVTLVLLNLLQTLVFACLHYGYVINVFPPELFGPMITISKLGQSLCMLMTTLIDESNLLAGSLVFAVPSCVLCMCWAVGQARLRYRGIEMYAHADNTLLPEASCSPAALS